MMQLKILEFKGGQVKRYFEKVIEKVSSVSKYTKLLHKYNSLSNKYDVLEEDMKNKAYELVMKAITEQPTIDRLTEENKKLRIKLRETKAERDEYIAALKMKGNSHGTRHSK